MITDDGIISDVFSTHDHTSASTGGTAYEIKRANYKNMIEMDMSLNVFAAAFKATAASSGAMTDQVDTTAKTKFVQFLTAATNNDWIVGEAGGGRLTFGSPITFQLKQAISNNTSITYRMGVGTPRINDAMGTGAQMGFEGCTGTDANNRVFSSDGTTWSGENMLNMVPNANPVGLRIDLYPTAKIVAQDSLGTVINKTTNLPPVSGATDSLSTCRIGVKALSAAVRSIKLFGVRLVGNSYDSTGSVQGWI